MYVHNSSLLCLFQLCSIMVYIKYLWFIMNTYFWRHFQGPLIVSIRGEMITFVFLGMNIKVCKCTTPFIWPVCRVIHTGQFMIKMRNNCKSWNWYFHGKLKLISFMERFLISQKINIRFQRIQSFKTNGHMAYCFKKIEINQSKIMLLLKMFTSFEFLHDFQQKLTV